MTEPVFQYSFPPMTSTDWIILSLAALAAFSGLVMLAMPDREREEWMGRIPQPRWLFVLLALLFIPLFVLALLFAFKLLTAAISEKPIDVSFGTGALIAAILGAPFVIWRSYVAQRQANTQDESLFNDKINAAVTDLAARRQVTHAVGRGKEQRVLTEWQDDIVARIAAIDRLSGLATEKAAENDYATVNRFLQQLAVYIRETSRRVPHQVPPYNCHPKDYRTWGVSLPEMRADIQFAFSALVRISSMIPAGKVERIDLSTANLQRLVVYGGLKGNSLTLINIDFSDAKLDGATFKFMDIRSCDLVRTNFRGTLFQSVKMNSCDLIQCDFKGSVLGFDFSEIADNADGHFINSNNFQFCEFDFADFGRMVYRKNDISIIRKNRFHGSAFLYIENERQAEQAQIIADAGETIFHRGHPWVKENLPDKQFAFLNKMVSGEESREIWHDWLATLPTE